jgi:hypothetical protein
LCWPTHGKSPDEEVFLLPFGLAALLLVYVVILITGLPPSVRSTELFSPFFWSAGMLLPSVGQMNLLGLFLI